MKIASVVARQLLDCRARPLVEVEITTDTGHVSRGASPAGTTVGVHGAFVRGRLSFGRAAELFKAHTESFRDGPFALH